MAPPKKLYWQCNHCGREEQSSDNPDGFVVNEVNDIKSVMIKCPCGIFTKICQTDRQLRVLWNSRPSKPFEEDTITVNHPPPRGMKKGDTVIKKINGQTIEEDPF